MKYLRHYQCTECGATYPISEPMNLCPNDARPVQMILDCEAIKRDFPDFKWFHSDVNSMWRFGPLMPFDITAQSNKVCSLGEGATPIIDITDYDICKSLGLNVYIKDEGQAYKGYGSNPTASFKDRGMSLVSTMAKHYGLDKLVVPTQGNAGDSLSEYGINFGQDVTVIMPDDTPMPIMGKVAAYSVIHQGIDIQLVKGTIREAAIKMKEMYLPHGWFNCATFQEPGWRIEGKKTMGLELAQPWPGIKPTWELPDAVLYPTGGGTGILGMWKAFDELEKIGVIDSRRPKIISVQSELNMPIVSAIQQGSEDTVATDGGETIATGINVPGGVGHKAVLKIIRSSGGGAIAVSEADIELHSKGIFAHRGMWISPEGAATVAALKQAKDNGLVDSNDTVVCFNTGSAEKYLSELRHIFMSDIA